MNETLPHQLREAGYRTGVAGKWHLVPVDEESSILSPDAYEEAKGFAYAAGFDWAGGFYEHNMGKAWKTPDPTLVIIDTPLSLQGRWHAGPILN